MTTHHGGDRDLDSHVENTWNIDDNESTSSSEITIAFGGSEADSHLSDLLPNSQADLQHTHNRNKQLITTCSSWRRSTKRRIGPHRTPRTGHSLTLSTQSTSTLTPTEPFGEVVCQYTDTLCTKQKQTHFINSILQDIAIFNKHDSTKLEEWLIDIETAADLTSESQAKLVKAKFKRIKTYISHRSYQFLRKHGMTSMIYLDSNCAILTLTHTPCISWIYNSGRRNH